MDKDRLVGAIEKASRALKGMRNENDTVTISVKNGVMEVAGITPKFCIWATEDTDAGDMECSVKASLCLAILNQLCGDIQMSLEKSGLRFRSATAQLTLPVCPGLQSDFDIRSAGYTSEVKTKGLLNYVEQTLHATEPGFLNPRMSAVHLEVFEGGGFQVTALDGKRYSIRNTVPKEDEQNAVLAAEYSVYGKPFAEALKLIDGDEVIIYKPQKGNFIRLRSENLEVAVGLLDGFFNLDALRTKNLPVRIVLDKGELESANSLVRLLSRVALWDIDSKGIRVVARDIMGESEVFVPGKVVGLCNDRVIKAAFNASYIADALHFMDASTICIHLRDGANQFCITDGKNAIEAILPIRRT